MEKHRWHVGDYVDVPAADYEFSGTVVAVFVKLDGQSRRYVVENDRRDLRIFAGDELREFVLET